MNKQSEVEASVARRSSASATPSSEIDVVNLSSQLISMELLSSSSQCLRQQTSASKSRKRKLTQKVRFDLPDDIEAKNQKASERRQKSPSPERKRPVKIKKSPSPHPEIRKKKVAVRKWNYSKLSWKSVPCPSTSTKLDLQRDDAGQIKSMESLSDHEKVQGVLTESSSNDVTKAHGFSDVIKLAMNKNNNCSSLSYHRLSQKGKTVHIKKSKSDSSAMSQKLKSVKRLKVVSKKIKVKTEKLQKGVKRKYSQGSFGDSSNTSGSKKRRRLTEKRSKVQRGHPCDRSHKKQSKTHTTCKKGSRGSVTQRSKSRLYKSKSLNPKIKQANAKLQKAKKTKKASLQKKIKQRLDKAAKKKSMLKKRCTKKLSAKRNTTKTKKKNKNIICSCHGYKRLRIRPIKRNDDYDVIPALRVTFLKYLTFKSAHAQKNECCRKYCWDKWEEPDMDDIIDDYE